MELICYLHCISDHFIYDSGIDRCSVTNDYFYLFILFQPVSKNPFSLFQHSNESIQICVANNDIVYIPFLHKTINANTTSCLFYLHLKNAFSSKATIETETFFPKYRNILNSTFICSMIVLRYLTKSRTFTTAPFYFGADRYFRIFNTTSCKIKKQILTKELYP